MYPQVPGSEFLGRQFHQVCGFSPGRHDNVSNAMKDYAEEKLQGIIDEYRKISSARAILDIQKSRFFAEVIIHGKNINVEADHESYDMYESIENAADKAEKQIRRYFDKIQDHHKSSRLPQIHLNDEEDENEVDFE